MTTNLFVVSFSSSICMIEGGYIDMHKLIYMH